MIQRQGQPVQHRLLDRRRQLPADTRAPPPTSTCPPPPCTGWRWTPARPRTPAPPRSATSSIGNPVTTTMTPQPPADPCPASWTCTDVGNPNPPGDTTSSGPGTFTLDGTGTGITLGGTDSFHYVYQQVSGNQTLSAQVVTQAGSPATAQEGIMMRANASIDLSLLRGPAQPGRVGDHPVARPMTGCPTGPGRSRCQSVTSPAYVEIVRWQDTDAEPDVLLHADVHRRRQLDAGARLHPGDQHGHRATWQAWPRRPTRPGWPRPWSTTT